MTCCPECGHRRQIDQHGLVQPHSMILVDYVEQSAARAQCTGGGAPPARREGRDEAVEQQLALFDVG